jgi:uncharacterized membrane protein
MKDKLINFWRKIPRALRSGIITAWVTFVGTLVAILTNLLPDLADAISSGNYEPFYESLKFGSAAAISAVTAFFSGVVNAIYRWIRPIADAYKTDPK